MYYYLCKLSGGPTHFQHRLRAARKSRESHKLNLLDTSARGRGKNGTTVRMCCVLVDVFHVRCSLCLFAPLSLR